MTLSIKLLIGVFVMTIIGLVAFQFIGNGFNNTVIGVQSSTTAVSDMYKVYISGEVNNGDSYYYVNIGATLEDLIESANGVTSNADELCYEESLELEDNASYYIAPIYDVSDVCGNNKLTKYNINSCTKEELQQISGVGATLSENIISYRESIGNFYQLEDIMKVSGVGNSTFSKIKNYIRIKD